MSHPAYKPPLRFVLRLRLQKGGGVFAGHYGMSIVRKVNTMILSKATRPASNVVL